MAQEAGLQVRQILYCLESSTVTWSVPDQALWTSLCRCKTQLCFPAVTSLASSGYCSSAWLLCCNRRINPAGFAPGFVMPRRDRRRGGGIHHVLAGVLLVSAASSVCKIAPVELNMVFLCAPESAWTHITEHAGGLCIFVKLKVLCTSWENSFGKSSLRKAKFELSSLEKGEGGGSGEPSARKNGPWDSTKDQKRGMFVIVRTTERAKKETPKHNKWRRKALTTHHSRLDHEKPEAHGQITNQGAKSSLISSSCAQFFTTLNWFEGAELLLIRVSQTTIVYFVTARLPTL